jgi:hypothetical protein
MQNFLDGVTAGHANPMKSEFYVAEAACAVLDFDVSGVVDAACFRWRYLREDAVQDFGWRHVTRLPIRFSLELGL